VSSSEVQELKEQIESLQRNFETHLENLFAEKLKDQKLRNEKLVQERTSTLSLVESLQTALNQTKESFSKQTQLLEQERQKISKKKTKIRSLKEQIQASDFSSNLI
jgi:chromosome segregation ATPase